MRMKIQSLKPTVTANGKYPAAFNTPIIYDQVRYFVYIINMSFMIAYFMVVCCESPPSNLVCDVCLVANQFPLV